MSYLSDVLVVSFAFLIGLTTIWIAFPGRTPRGFWQWIGKLFAFLGKLALLLVLLGGLWASYLPLFFRPSATIPAVFPILTALAPPLIAMWLVVAIEPTTRRRPLK